MRTTEKLFLIFWIAGILALVSALFGMRLTWRQDARPFGRHTPVLDILIHPEKYVSPNSVNLVRWLIRLGCACLAIGAALLVQEA